MIGRWRRRDPLEEARRREFLWAVGGEEELTDSLVRLFAAEIERAHGVRPTDRVLRVFVKFVPSLPDAWAKAVPETHGRSPEQFLEERATEFVRELDLTNVISRLPAQDADSG